MTHEVPSEMNFFGTTFQNTWNAFCNKLFNDSFKIEFFFQNDLYLGISLRVQGKRKYSGNDTTTRSTSCFHESGGYNQIYGYLL